MQTYVFEDKGVGSPIDAKPIWEGDLDVLPGGIPLALPGEPSRRQFRYRWVRLDQNADPSYQRGTQFVVVGKKEGS